MPIELDAEGLRAARMNAQLLMGPPAAGVVGAVRGAAAVQAQDLNASRLAVRARTSGLVVADVRRAIAEERSIIRTWAMRGTLHAIPAADAGWMVGLLGPVFVAKTARRRAELGLDDDLCARAESAMADLLFGGRALTRAELVDELVKADVPVPPSGQAPAHLVSYASLRGLICRGPDREDGEPTYVLTREWVGTWDSRDTDSALAKLARRYLWGHGPAGLADFAAWSGLPAAMARRGWELVAKDTEEVATPYGPMLAPREFAESLPSPPSPWQVRLVGAFDSYLLGYKDRGFALPGRHAHAVVPGGGIIHPAVLVNGRAVARWKWAADRRTIVVEPFGALAPELPQGIVAEVVDIGRFLGVETRLKISDPPRPRVGAVPTEAPTEAAGEEPAEAVGGTGRPREDAS
ncbi:winged helix DNA-binding domain-containing protein [Streptomonospora nanhaiensis]|uniref:winged helix DNA-binding domain-containing protein n=1 Tax=Streptomonospora nanhaiensis TaxID=1323731 RepID=UPI001C3907B9|nr:winged helix DNA-binding domain-containing protein [Streptomonospora nanhaiensis]MBV2367000.1 winged helix DNA-binding domain-containing protein [Streptomonospora nanhaiensis]